MNYLPPLKSLHFFCVAGQTLSFKRAAEELNVTQAAVSQQIRQLEEYLKVPLFDRSKKQTVLTEHGRRMLPFIQKAFDELKGGVNAVVGDPRPNVLRISTLHSFTSLWLLPRLEEFQTLHPEIMIQLAPANELIDFKQTDMDLAIRMGPGGYQPLLEKKIIGEHLVLVVSPSLITGIDKHDPKQVFSLPWLEDSSSRLEQSITACCHKFSIARETLQPFMQSANAVPLIESAVSGRGILMVNRGLVADHLRAGRLVTLLDYCFESDYSLYMVAPSSQFEWSKVKIFEQWFIPKVLESFADDKW